MFRIILSFCFLLSFTVVRAQDKQVAQPQTAESRRRFEQLELFNKVLYLIETQYYRQVDTEKLVEGALRGMMETLDPHSSFMNKDIFQRMQNDTAGEFGGLGLEVAVKDGAVIIITPIEDTPAWRAGIRPKDRIMEINHESIVGMSLDQAIERMKGKNGSVVHLGIAREGADGLKHFNVKREIIKINPVKSEMVQGNVAYVRLTQFQKRASESVEEALKKLKAEADKKGGLSGIIIDLRANPGGLLDQAVDMSSLFLKDGLVVSTESRDPQNKDIRYVKKQGWKDLTTPVAVLINGSSASASEIVAGALQDHQRALIMGSQSFGKGSVQTVAQLDGGTGVKLTIAQYMTPAGRRIQGVGITPDIAIDDVDPAAFDRAKRPDRWTRERDLRNHLAATKETPDEKKVREEMELQDRRRRADAIEKRNRDLKAKKDPAEEEDTFRPYKASEDYQVNQAAGFLKAMKVLEAPKAKI